MLKKLIFLAQRFACVFGWHDWLVVRNSRKDTGKTTSHLFFMIHELQEDHVCGCCRLHRTVYGRVPPLYSYDRKVGNYKFNEFGWPLDKAGNKLPSYVCTGESQTYQWYPKPKYHGKAGPEIIGYKPSLG